MYNYINQNLGVVNFPDSLGLACDFQPFSFYLGGKRTYWGLPNNPEYDLGPVVGSACDTLTNKVNEIIKIAFTVYPNPTSNEITVYSNELFNKSKLRIFNSIGELVRCVELPDQQMLTTVSLIELPPGIYSYQINSSNNLDKKDKFVIIK